MAYIDTHTHLYDEAFPTGEEMDQAVGRAIEAGVDMMILPDISSKERGRMVGLYERWKNNTRICAALHPTEIGEDWKQEVLDFQSFVNSRSDIVAIGETGMDLYWSKEFEAVQRDVFRLHIETALQKGLPLLIHARNATDEIFRVLEDYRGRGCRGIFHAFSGSIETFRRLERYGDWLVGIGGVLTFKNAGIAQVVKEIPLERIVLETDSPYLTPVPFRGKRNESAYIPHIASFLAQLKEVPETEIERVTTANARRILGL